MFHQNRDRLASLRMLEGFERIAVLEVSVPSLRKIALGVSSLPTAISGRRRHLDRQVQLHKTR